MIFKNLYKKYSFKSVDGSASGLIELNQEQLNDLHCVLLDIVDDVMSFCQKKA